MVIALSFRYSTKTAWIFRFTGHNNEQLPLCVGRFDHTASSIRYMYYFPNYRIFIHVRYGTAFIGLEVSSTFTLWEIESIVPSWPSKIV